MCPTSTIQDLKVQAQKLTLYLDWAALIISGSKTKVTGILRSHPSKDHNGVTCAQLLSQNLLDKIEIQGQKAQFLPSDKPFPYLGVQLTMDLNWKHQIQHMTCKLGDKLEKLDFSQTSPRQAKDMIRIAISPSLAYAFAVTPCTPADLIIWDKMIDRTIKHKDNLAKSTPAAMIRPSC